MFNKDELNQLYRYALSLSKHEEVAYDLVQTAIERLLSKPPDDVSSIENPLAYLKTIIRNHYFDLERRKKVVPMISIENDSLSLIEPVDDNSMEDALINQQEVQLLIESLNTQENELLYLWAVEEHTVEEIAAIYEKPRGTMLSKLHRLKKRVREQLQLGSVELNVMSNKQ